MFVDPSMKVLFGGGAATNNNHIDYGKTKTIELRPEVDGPVPASAINANTQVRIDQNEGYPGAENNVAPLTVIPEN